MKDPNPNTFLDISISVDIKLTQRLIQYIFFIRPPSVHTSGRFRRFAGVCLQFSNLHLKVRYESERAQTETAARRGRAGGAYEKARSPGRRGRRGQTRRLRGPAH